MAMAMEAITTGVTANTMSTDAQTVRRVTPLSLWIPSTAVLIGLALVVLATPRIAAYGILLSVKSRIAPSLSQGEMLPPALLDESIRAYVRAAAWMPKDADIQQTLARLYLRQVAISQSDNGSRKVALNDSLARIDAALRAAPNRHLSWTLRADILTLIGLREPEVEEALRMSYLLGPYEASSMLLRSRIILKIWTRASPKTQAIAKSDLKSMWETHWLRQNLVRLYLDQPLPARILIRRFALSSKQDSVQFNRRVGQAVRKEIRNGP